MAQTPAQPSGSQNQAAKVDENTELLQQIAVLVEAVKELADQAASTSTPTPVPQSAPPSTEDQVFQRQVGAAYNLLGTMLGRGTEFESQLVFAPVKRVRRELTFVDLRGATAARVRARVDGVDEVADFDSLSNGAKVTLGYDADQPIDGIELLDKPDGAVVAFGRIEP